MHKQNSGSTNKNSEKETGMRHSTSTDLVSIVFTWDFSVSNTKSRLTDKKKKNIFGDFLYHGFSTMLADFT